MLKVLIVDDEPTSRLIAEDFLKEVAQCDSVVTAAEGLELYKQSQSGQLYDIVLLDFDLPETNGVEFLKILRAFELTTSTARAVPVIMTTSERSVKSDSMKKGCDEFIVKPIEKKVLLAKIEELMRSNNN